MKSSSYGSPGKNGGGGTRSGRSQPDQSMGGGAAHKGTMGTGQTTPQAKGVMGTGSPVATHTKRVMGSGT